MADTTAHNYQKAAAISVVAGVMGAGLALLFAPRSGKETRHKLRKDAHQMKMLAEKRVTSARQTAVTKLDQAVERAKKVSEELRQAAENTAEVAKKELKKVDDEK